MTLWEPCLWVYRLATMTLVKALDECANRETILHIEISPLVKDHREFLNEQPRVTASGSRHVHFALEPPEIMNGRLGHP